MRIENPFFKAVTGAAALLVSACGHLEPIEPIKPVKGPVTQSIGTDYSVALRCVARHARAQSYLPPRIAVGHITDLTGASDYFTGRRLTQGATLMAITAVSDAGMRLVERYDMGVIQVELDYAQSGLVRDSQNKLREIKPGQLQGADLYIIGGITEFNPNIRSRDGDFFVGGTTEAGGALAIGKSDYVIDVGLDLRMVDARSSEVLSVRSFRKQIIGKEIEAGVFDFLDGTVIDIGGGQRAQEPVQTAVRTMIDRAVFEFVSSLYALEGESCLNSPELRARYASVADLHKRGSDGFNISSRAPQKVAAPAASSPQTPQGLDGNLPRTQPGPPAQQEPSAPSSTAITPPARPQLEERHQGPERYLHDRALINRGGGWR